MTTQWFYRMFGEEFGPIEEPALQEMRESGTLGPEDEIRREGSARWQTLAACFPAGGVATAVGQSSRELDVQDSGDDDPVWYCLTTGQELGPLSFHELHDLAEQGVLTAEDQVKLGVKGKYRRAGSMGRLAAVMDYQAIERPSQATTVQATAETRANTLQPEPPATVEPPAAPIYSYLPGAEELTWYAWIRGVECGPVNLVQLAQWLQAGQIGPTDFVKYGPYGAWLPPAPTIEQSLRQFVVVQAAPVPPPKAAPVKPPVEPAKPAAEATKPKPAEPASTTKPATSLAETQPLTKKGTDPALETKPAASPVEATKPVAPIPKPEPEPVRSYSSPSSSGGFGSPMAAAMRTPPKPAAKKKSGGGGGGLDLGALFANPLVLKGGGGAAVVALLVAGFMFMPQGTGAERADYEVLNKILVDFRKLRDDKADDAAFNKFAEEAKKNAKPVIDRLKPIASAKRRDRQFLLWAARDRLPGMLTDARQEPSFAESEFEYNVMSAAFILRLGPDPKTVKRIEPVATKGKAPPVVD